MNKRKGRKMFLSIFLVAFCLLVKLSVSVQAADEKEEFWMEIPASELVEEELPAHELSAPESMLFTLDANGQPVLSSGTSASWYGRLDLTDVPGYVEEFHDWLLKNSDGDSIDDAENPCATDWLIDPTKGQLLAEGKYVYEVCKFEWTVDFNNVPAIDGDYDKGIKAYLDSVVQPEFTANFAEATSYITAVYNAFDRDCPEVFWLSGSSMVGSALASTSFSYSYNDNGASGSVPYTQSVYFYLKDANQSFDIRATNYQTTEVIKATMTDRDTAVTNILAGMNGLDLDTVYEKVTYFNDWLTKNNAYNNSSNLNTIGHDCRECTGALFGTAGANGPVCEAYARAFKVLCDKEGITCTLVSGDSYSGSSGVGEPHMWNLVADEKGNYYAVDVAWNDPMLAGSDSIDVVSGVENRKYLMVGNNTIIDGKQFENSHVTTNRVSSSGAAFINQPVTQLDEYAYIIKFMYNNGTQEFIEGYAPLGSEIVLPDFSVMQYEGYIINGFNTKYDGSGISYTLQELQNGALNLKEDIELFAVWKEDTIGEKLEGYQISLDGNINVNFYFTFDEKLLGNPDAYMQITLPNKSAQKVFLHSLTPKEVMVNEEPEYYYEISCEVAAKEMASNITLQVIASEEQKSREYTYTVKQYAEELLWTYGGLNDEKSKALVNLVSAMLNYGAYAQIHFGFNTEYLANKNINQDMQNEEYFKEILENPDNYFVPMTLNYPEGNAIGTFTKANLTLESLTSLNVYFKPAAGVNMEDLLFTLNENTITPVQKGTNGEYLLKASDIRAQQIGDKCEFSVRFKGDTSEGIALSYNALSYGYDIVTGDYSEDIKNLCAALYEYYSCANTYVQNY